MKSAHDEQKLKFNVQSIRDNLRKITTDKESFSYQDIESAFLLERMATRIVSSENLKQCLIFKGGFVSLRVYDSDRYTIDLDALLVNRSKDKVIVELQNQIESPFSDGVWFKHVSNQDLKALGEYGGIRLNFKAGIGSQPKNLKKYRKLHLDVGIGDPITPSPVQLQTPMLIDETSLSWQVYPVETTVAEKIQTLIARGHENSRSKDIYDIYILINRTEAKVLDQALKRTFSYRDTPFPDSISRKLEKIDVSALKRGWISTFKGKQNPPDFDNIWIKMISEIKNRGY